MADYRIDVYEDGEDLTGRAVLAVTAKRFLKISGDRQGVIAVAPADDGGRVCGVAKVDAPIGAVVAIARGNARVVHVTASGLLTAFDEVQVGAAGQAVTKSTGTAVGYVLTGAAAGTDAEVSLY